MRFGQRGKKFCASVLTGPESASKKLSSCRRSKSPDTTDTHARMQAMHNHANAFGLQLGVIHKRCAHQISQPLLSHQPSGMVIYQASQLRKAGNFLSIGKISNNGDSKKGQYV